ncbi:MAG: hypothetical protein ACMXYK_00560 [Candidatus Woesearchaeota archaeon]
MNYKSYIQKATFAALVSIGLCSCRKPYEFSEKDFALLDVLEEKAQVLEVKGHVFNADNRLRQVLHEFDRRDHTVAYIRGGFVSTIPYMHHQFVYTRDEDNRLIVNGDQVPIEDLIQKLHQKIRPIHSSMNTSEGLLDYE